MATGVRVYWEVRTPANGGSSLNGGGFDPSVSVPGADLTQQSPIARTDMVIGAANTITSVAIPFSSSEVGNVLHVNSGTGWTPGFYTILSISGVTVTLQGSPGTLASTGGTGRVGGPLSTINDTPAITGGIVWMQAGLGYTTAVQWLPNNGVGAGNFVQYVGYQNARGDGGLATLVCTNAVASPVIGQADQTIWRNLVIDGANLATRGMDLGSDCYVENVEAIRCTLSGLRAQNEGTRVRRCLFVSCGAGAVTGTGLDVGTGARATECEAVSCENGFSSSNGSGEFSRCIARGSTLGGFYSQGDDGLRMLNCTADGNLGGGLLIDDARACVTLFVENCLFSNNPYGIQSVTTDASLPQYAALASFFQSNGFYNNATANYGQVPAGATDVIVTADPYTNRAGLDFSLNGNNPGGAQLTGVGAPGGFGLLGAGAAVSVGHTDIGAVQGLAAAPASSDLATARSLWREMTNERFTPADETSAVPDSRVDIWLQFGANELNNRIHYHVTEATLSLTAGVQEMTLPKDYIQDIFARFANYRVLQKFDIERARNRGEDWQNEPPGDVQSYATYSNKIVLRPAPSAEAVAASPTITLRYVNTPPSVTTSGFDQLPTQYHRYVVIFGAYLYSVCYPESLVAQQRLTALKQEFEDSVKAIIADYAKRNLST